MAYAVNFSRRAEIDLDLVFIAIDAENSEAALKWYFGLQDALMTSNPIPTADLSLRSHVSIDTYFTAARPTSTASYLKFPRTPGK